MKRKLSKGLALVTALAALSACGNFFDEGPDPAKAGRVQSGGGGGVGGTSGYAGSSGTCNSSQPLTVVLSASGATCSMVTSCLQNRCGGSATCLGPDRTTGSFTGGDCPSYLNCVVACHCNQNCALACAPDANGRCENCLTSLVSCTDSNCANEFSACQGTGGNGGMGGTAATGGTSGTGGIAGTSSAMIVTEGVAAIDMAFDIDSIYCTTSEGVVRVPKAGGPGMSLTFLNGLKGLAVSGGFVYVVEDSGALTRMSTDGQGLTTVAPATYGGGSGAIVAAGNGMSYTVGQYLRMWFDGFGSVELASDVAPINQGSIRILAVDMYDVYYVSGPARQQLRVHTTNPNAGFSSGPVFDSSGVIGAVVLGGENLYLTETIMTSPARLQVTRITPYPWNSSQLATVPAQGGPPFLGAGIGLATDGNDLYFAGMQGGLLKVSVDGGTVQTLDSTAMPGAIAHDGVDVYWSDPSSSRIMKLAR